MAEVSVTKNKEGISIVDGPGFEYEPIDVDNGEARFVVLHPRPGGNEDYESYDDPTRFVKCTVEVQRLEEAQPFVAIRNARGYRLLQAPINMDGKHLLVSVALEKFLRHYRKSDGPVRLWVRYLCVNQQDQNELARQFTREYVDTMYEKAQSVVDMHAFLRDLRDQGTVRFVFDARYKDWTKDWDLRPQSYPLPKVYPVRLGSKPATDGQPSGAYEYVPLDVIADETRIIVINNNVDRDAPLALHLAHNPVVSEVAYHALSYTWGTETETQEIVMMGHRFRIRKNLETILRAMRSPTHGTAVWVDAICINQSDISERNHQIDRIAEIYDRAVAVICYIGKADKYSDAAFEVAHHLTKEPVVRTDDAGNWEIGKPDRVSKEKVVEYCASLYLLLSRPYFRRIWVIQEIAMASNPVAACGTRFDVSLETLDGATHKLYSMITRDPELREEMKKYAPEIAEVDPGELFFIRKLFYFRHLQMGGVRFQARKVDVNDNAPGYLESAILARNFQASVPHDKIFALWNVAQDKEGFIFKMDYSKTFQQTYLDFAKAWCLHSGSLDMIGAAEFVPGSKSDDFYSLVPSWVPDWSVPSQANCLIRREVFRMENMEYMDDINGPVYWADGAMRQASGQGEYFGFQGDTLHCTGIVLDRIMAIQPLTTSEKPTIESRITGLFPAMEDFYAAIGDTAPYEDLPQALMAMLHGDVPSAWPKRADNPEDARDDYPEETHVAISYKPRFGREQRPNASRNIPYFATGYRRREAWDVLCDTMRGRRTFISQDKHYMGLMPLYIDIVSPARPIHLAILATCSVPVLLREHPDVEGAYQLLGTCFVQGWMEGEVLREEMGCDEPSEFWEAMKGAEKLKIL